jgi:hypothetical protein
MTRANSNSRKGRWLFNTAMCAAQPAWSGLTEATPQGVLPMMPRPICAEP